MDRINIIKPIVKKIAIGFLLAFLTACQSPSFLGNNKLDNASDWIITGKITVIYPEETCRAEVCRKKSEQGGLSWRQSGKSYEIAFSDPFGRVLSLLKGNGQQANLTTGKKQYQINNVDSYIKTNLKLDATIESLESWLKGIPNNEFSVKYLGKNKFEQQGFIVQTSEYKNYGTRNLPHFIIVSNSKSKVKIFIDKWVVNQ